MDATGKIIAVLPASSGVSQRTGNTWMVQTYVLETVEQYPKKIPFEIFGEDRIKQFAVQMNETVTISFDVDGREWNGRWFPSIRCYNVVRPNQQQAVAQPQPQVQQPVSQPQLQQATAPFPPSDNSGGDDGLPF